MDQVIASTNSSCWGSRSAEAMSVLVAFLKRSLLFNSRGSGRGRGLCGCPVFPMS